jgi:oligopeptide/dipeptide ABC transporter ATP-binding protein
VIAAAAPGVGPAARALACAPVLSIRGLRVSFRTPAGPFAAVAGIDLDLHAGETLGVVGESGSGKSVTALSVLGLLPRPAARVEAGAILFEGRDLLKLPDAQLRTVRGNRIAMIFQEPMTSLNPVFTIGNQIEEVLLHHTDLPAARRRERCIELLEMVGVPAAKERLRAYPHVLSGGLRQRVMIAMALACNPAVLIADEPTTALDVTIAAQILELVAELKQRLRMAVLWITHDLGIVAETAQRVAVLYAGRVVESGPVDAIFHAPRHPYTRGLLRSLPGRSLQHRALLPAIPGTVPDLAHRPSGCAFRSRCDHADAVCAELDPEPIASGAHAVACHHPQDAAVLPHGSPGPSAVREPAR